MSIRVRTYEAISVQSFPQATGWVVDNGYLHVIVKDNGNCATFHPSAWLSVERDEAAK